MSALALIIVVTVLLFVLGTDRTSPTRRIRRAITVFAWPVLTYMAFVGGSRLRGEVIVLHVVVATGLSVPIIAGLLFRMINGDYNDSRAPVVFLRPFYREREVHVPPKSLPARFFERDGRRKPWIWTLAVSLGILGLILLGLSSALTPQPTGDYILDEIAQKDAAVTRAILLTPIFLGSSLLGMALIWPQLRQRNFIADLASAARARIGPAWGVTIGGLFRAARSPSMILGNQFGSDWKDIVTWLVSRARVTIFLAGDTQALTWEFQCARANADPRRVFILSDPIRDHLDAEWDSIRSMIEGAGFRLPDIPFLPAGAAIGFDAEARGELIAQVVRAEDEYIDSIYAHIERLETQIGPMPDVVVAVSMLQSLPPGMVPRLNGVSALALRIVSDRLGLTIAGLAAAFCMLLMVWDERSVSDAIVPALLLPCIALAVTTTTER